MSNIRHLQRKEIDEHKWNALVEQSAGSLPYAYTWYLDSVAENWDALVTGDYDIIMPLVWLRKFGLKCMYQPYYCQQLGFFSRAPVLAQTAEAFLNTARKRFFYINTNLNPNAKVVSEKMHLTGKKNLILPLDKEYDIIRKQYSENHRRNIGKADKAGLVFSENTGEEKFIWFYLANVDREKENFKPKHAEMFTILAKTLLARNKAKIFTVIGKEQNIMAAVMMAYHQNRAISIINSSSAEGKMAGASHFLFDKIIQLHCAQEVLFDFEGSSVPSIARFYEGFGAKEETFYNYKATFWGL